MLLKRYGKPMPLSVKLQKAAIKTAKQIKRATQMKLRESSFKRLSWKELEKRPQTRQISSFLDDMRKLKSAKKAIAIASSRVQRRKTMKMNVNNQQRRRLEVIIEEDEEGDEGMEVDQENSSMFSKPIDLALPAIESVLPFDVAQVMAMADLTTIDSDLPPGKHDVVREKDVVDIMVYEGCDGYIHTINGTDDNIEFMVGIDDYVYNYDNDISNFITPDLKSQMVAPKELNVQKPIEKEPQSIEEEREKYFEKVRDAVEEEGNHLDNLDDGSLLSNGFDSTIVENGHYQPLCSLPSEINDSLDNSCCFNDVENGVAAETVEMEMVASSKQLDKSNDLIEDNYKVVLEVIEDQRFVDKNEDDLPLCELQRQWYLQKWENLNRTAVVFNLPEDTDNEQENEKKNQTGTNGIPNGNVVNSTSDCTDPITSSDKTEMKSQSKKITSRRNRTAKTSSIISEPLKKTNHRRQARSRSRSQSQSHSQQTVQSVADTYNRLQTVISPSLNKTLIEQRQRRPQKTTNGLITSRRLNLDVVNDDDDDFITFSSLKNSS